MTLFIVIDVGCEECCEPTQVIDVFYAETPARDCAVKLASTRATNAVLDDGPRFGCDWIPSDQQTCIAYWGPIEVHKLSTAASDSDATGREASPVESLDATGADGPSPA